MLTRCLTIGVDLAIHFLVAGAGDSVQILAFSGTFRGQPDPCIGIVGAASFGVVELGRFKVAIFLGNIAEIVQRKGTVRVERVGLRKSFLAADQSFSFAAETPCNVSILASNSVSPSF